MAHGGRSWGKPGKSRSRKRRIVENIRARKKYRAVFGRHETDKYDEYLEFWDRPALLAAFVGTLLLLAAIIGVILKNYVPA